MSPQLRFSITNISSSSSSGWHRSKYPEYALLEIRYEHRIEGKSSALLRVILVLNLLILIRSRPQNR